MQADSSCSMDDSIQNATVVKLQEQRHGPQDLVHLGAMPIPLRRPWFRSTLELLNNCSPQESPAKRIIPQQLVQRHELISVLNTERVAGSRRMAGSKFAAH